jgi:hypothetical protein
MAVSLISTRLLEIISKSAVGNARSPRKRPFSDFNGYFQDESGGYPPMGPEEKRVHTTGLPQPSIHSRY